MARELAAACKEFGETLKSAELSQLVSKVTESFDKKQSTSANNVNSANTSPSGNTSLSTTVGKPMFWRKAQTRIALSLGAIVILLLGIALWGRGFWFLDNQNQNELKVEKGSKERTVTRPAAVNSEPRVQSSKTLPVEENRSIEAEEKKRALLDSAHNAQRSL